MGRSAEAILTWGVKLDEIPWTEQEREDCENDRHQWLAEKLGLVAKGETWLGVANDEWPVSWASSGSSEEDEGPFVLGVQEMTTEGCWEGPTEVQIEQFSGEAKLMADGILVRAWAKIKPAGACPLGQWYLCAYWG